MLIDRRVFPVKPGHEQEAAQFFRDQIEANTAYTGGYRIYIPDIGPYNVIVVEWEYETIQEMREAWAAWRAKPDSGADLETWHAIETGGGHGETWWLFAER